MGRKKKEENSTEEVVKKPKALSPFDIINMMFTNKEAFDKISNNLLDKNFFMINRIMSIQFPLQGQAFNQININKAQVIRTWQRFATSKCGYGRVPSFVYTKGAKATQDNSQQEIIDKDLKEQYCNHYNFTHKEFDDMIYFAHDITIEHLKNFENIIKLKDSITKSK